MPLPNDLPALAPRLLASLARTGNLTATARELGISQPAATKAIQRAESALGLALLRRDRRPLELTAEGGLLAEYAERRHELEESLAARLSSTRTQGAGLVRIGSFGSSASTRILPRLVADVERLRPQMRLEIREFTDEGAYEALRDGRVELATILARDAEDLELVEIAKDRLVALVPDHDPLARGQAVTAQDLSRRPFIMTKGGSEQQIRTWFGLSGLEPVVRHTALQVTSILAMVSSGLGVSMLAEMAVPRLTSGVRAVPLAPEATRHICLARRASTAPSHAAEQLWSLIPRLMTGT